MEKVFYQAPLFFIVFIRISALTLMAPFFSDKSYTAFLKVSFSLFISLLIFPTLNISSWIIPKNILSFLIMVIQEGLIALLIGLSLSIIIFAIEFVGHLMGYQMAFSMARTVDASTGMQTSVIASFLIFCAIMLIITVGIDHYIIKVMRNSFDVLRPGNIAVKGNIILALSKLLGKSFVLGFKIYSPVMIMFLVLNITLGLIGKAAAKLQIFFISLPAKILLGLFAIVLIVRFMVDIWLDELKVLPEFIMKSFYIMRGNIG